MRPLKIADADSAAEGGGSPSPGVPADTLTCGACRRAFALADIVRFIQHKVSSCDKDLTYHCYSAGPNSDQEDGSRTGQVATGNSSGRRPSLLTARRPPNSRVHTPPLVSPSIAPPDLIEDGGASSTPKRLLDEADAEASTPKRRASTSPMPSSSPDEDIKPKIKQEHMDTSGSPEDQKKSRTEVADAESNTMHSDLTTRKILGCGDNFIVTLRFLCPTSRKMLHNNNTGRARDAYVMLRTYIQDRSLIASLQK
ncbi:hypothetical protein RR48_14337 [Papilio machaon]|uniref:BCL-11A-like CCHC zinc finger domain-containing protein n=1 Tax=Papilio machaon TaxID=76193 RepID=A0A194QM15_PAPMA|nr:hypothetical protein RR48_14337 [Papilio machaon]